MQLQTIFAALISHELLMYAAYIAVALSPMDLHRKNSFHPVQSLPEYYYIIPVMFAIRRLNKAMPIEAQVSE